MSNNNSAFKAALRNAAAAEVARQSAAVQMKSLAENGALAGKQYRATLAAEEQVVAVLKEIDKLEKEWLSLPEEVRQRIRRDNPGLASMFVSVKQ